MASTRESKSNVIDRSAESAPQKASPSPASGNAESLLTVFLFGALILIFAACTIYSTVRSNDPLKAAIREVKKTRFAVPSLEHLAATIDQETAKVMPAKDQFLTLRNGMILGLFNYSKEPSIIAGKQGWLYLASENVLRCYKNAEPFTDDQMSQWQCAIEQRQKLVHDLGGELVVLCVPEKINAYPEFLPDGYRQTSTTNRFHQLQQFMKNRKSSVTILDPRALIATGKTESKTPLFLLTDSHWNEDCVLRVYKWLAAHVRDKGIDIQELTPAEVSLKPATYSGDCCRMLKLDGLVNETAPKFEFSKGETYSINGPPEFKSFINISRSVQSNEQIARALLPVTNPDSTVSTSCTFFHDSFFLPARSILARSFARSNFWWTRDLNFELINKDRPNVVVWELVERHLFDDPPPDVSWTDFSKFASPIYQWSGGALGAYNATLSGNGLTAETEDPQIFLPEFKVSGTKPKALRIRLQQPTETTVQIFWNTQGQPDGFDEKRSAAQLCAVGNREVTFALPANSRGPLRIDPGTYKGKYTIESIEIRE